MMAKLSPANSVKIIALVLITAWSVYSLPGVVSLGFVFIILFFIVKIMKRQK